MNSMQAFAKGEANRGKELMVFDWDKAVQIIKEKDLKNCAAGLENDFEWTAGMILVDGNPHTDDYTYLSSTWATPQLIICDEDGVYIDAIDCYIMESKTKYGANTKFPDNLAKEFK